MTTNNPPDFAQAWQQSWQEWASAWSHMAQPAADDQPPAPTPAEAWKRSMDRWLTAWSGFLEETMTQPDFAKAAGQMLNRTLDVQKPLRDSTETAMQRWLEAVNMPTRHDIIRLAEQVNEVNARLDDLGDRIDEIADVVATLGEGRTKRAADSAEVVRW